MESCCISLWDLLSRSPPETSNTPSFPAGFTRGMVEDVLGCTLMEAPSPLQGEGKGSRHVCSVAQLCSDCKAPPTPNLLQPPCCSPG
ncbi:hypothetical protein GDO78_014294 [Eleutherodactylus coqui]|uniref:Uncharacterized protein n=1 Tax=Eleutherodactylus coqui TaxID=57060 RepID=A0A8J6EEZ9_ELECQ|nr:hypothetical protein GDO78_014294 [Eleutherodactylus coqui]